jgi:hypothetical protein
MKAIFVVLIEKPDIEKPDTCHHLEETPPLGSGLRVFLGYFKGAEESMGPKRHV